MKKLKIKINNTYDELGLGWTIAIVVGALLLALGIVFGILCLEAWLFALLWNWVVPIFWDTAPHLEFWGAFGTILLLDTIGGFFRARVRKREE